MAFDSTTLMGTQNSDAVTITGGTIDGVALANTTRATGTTKLTNADISGNSTVGGNEAITGNLTVTANAAVTGNQTVTGTLAVTGVTTLSAMCVIPRATVAGAGTVLGNATQVVTGYTTVTGADGTVGVKLPATPVAGSLVILKNNAGAILKVYPDAAATINAIAANGAISMAANTAAWFIADSTTQWYTLPLLPS